VLELERGGNQPWTENELQMIETLVERLAMAIENARLYEQATRSAEREHIVNRIAQDVQSAKTIDKVLEAALTELSTVLGASRGIVQISPKIDGSETSE
jgi:GAF domain-containing protein